MKRCNWGWGLFLLWAVCYVAAWRLNVYGFPNYEPEGVWPVAASAVAYVLLLAGAWFSGHDAVPAWRIAAAAGGALLLVSALCAFFEPLAMLAAFILYLMLGFYGLAYPFGGGLCAAACRRMVLGA